MSDIHPAKKAAIDIFKSYSFGQNLDNLFPIDCRVIAEGFGIQVVGEPMDQEFQACLYLSGNVKAIIYNSSIQSQGRINFTIGHELGHYFLHRQLGDQKCSIADLENIGSLAPHSNDVEREANLFAANLLMPLSDFRKQLLGGLPDLRLISGLCARYGTSLLASLYRLKEVSSKPVAVLFVTESNTVISVWKNRHFDGLYIPPSHKISDELTDHLDISEVEHEYLGLATDTCPYILYQSSVRYKFQGLKIVLLTGEPL